MKEQNGINGAGAHASAGLPFPWRFNSAEGQAKMEYFQLYLTSRYKGLHTTLKEKVS